MREGGVVLTKHTWMTKGQGDLFIKKKCV